MKAKAGLLKAQHPSSFIACPACGSSVPASTINVHLDTSCHALLGGTAGADRPAAACGAAADSRRPVSKQQHRQQEVIVLDDEDNDTDEPDGRPCKRLAVAAPQGRIEGSSSVHAAMALPARLRQVSLPAAGKECSGGGPPRREGGPTVRPGAARAQHGSAAAAAAASDEPARRASSHDGAPRAAVDSRPTSAQGAPCAVAAAAQQAASADLPSTSGAAPGRPPVPPSAPPQPWWTVHREPVVAHGRAAGSLSASKQRTAVPLTAEQLRQAAPFELVHNFLPARLAENLLKALLVGRGCGWETG